MKKATGKSTKRSEKQVTTSDSDEMRPHYDFDYSNARPNRFAERFRNETVAVILDTDVAEVFNSSESVNTVLRSAIKAMRSAGAKIMKTPAKRRAS